MDAVKQRRMQILFAVSCVTTVALMAMWGCSYVWRIGISRVERRERDPEVEWTRGVESEYGQICFFRHCDTTHFYEDEDGVQHSTGPDDLTPFKKLAWSFETASGLARKGLCNNDWDRYSSMAGFATGEYKFYHHAGGDYEGDFCAVPYWPVTLPLALVSILLLLRLTRARRRERKGLCQQCGYDLRATPHHCPECGAKPLVKYGNQT